MNDKIIEELLFKAPRPLAPASLLKELQAEIALPSAKAAPKAKTARKTARPPAATKKAAKKKTPAPKKKKS